MSNLNLEVWKNYSFTVPAAGSAANIAISAAVGALERLEVVDLHVAVDSATTTVGGVSVRIGFGAATIAALSSTDSTPAVGILLDHPGIAAGSGMHGARGMGAKNEELRATVETPTSGSVTITWLGRIFQVW